MTVSPEGGSWVLARYTPSLAIRSISAFSVLQFNFGVDLSGSISSNAMISLAVSTPDESPSGWPRADKVSQMMRQLTTATRAKNLTSRSAVRRRASSALQPDFMTL